MDEEDGKYDFDSEDIMELWRELDRALVTNAHKLEDMRETGEAPSEFDNICVVGRAGIGKTAIIKQ